MYLPNYLPIVLQYSARSLRPASMENRRRSTGLYSFRNRIHDCLCSHWFGCTLQFWQDRQSGKPSRDILVVFLVVVIGITGFHSRQPADVLSADVGDFFANVRYHRPSSTERKCTLSVVDVLLHDVFNRNIIVKIMEIIILITIMIKITIMLINVVFSKFSI